MLFKSFLRVTAKKDITKDNVDEVIGSLTEQDITRIKDTANLLMLRKVLCSFPKLKETDINLFLDVQEFLLKNFSVQERKIIYFFYILCLPKKETAEALNITLYRVSRLLLYINEKLIQLGEQFFKE